MDPAEERVTDELYVIGDDCGVNDAVAVVGEEESCGGTGLVQQAVG